MLCNFQFNRLFRPLIDSIGRMQSPRLLKRKLRVRIPDLTLDTTKSFHPWWLLGSRWRKLYFTFTRKDDDYTICLICYLARLSFSQIVIQLEWHLARLSFSQIMIQLESQLLVFYLKLCFLNCFSIIFPYCVYCKIKIHVFYYRTCADLSYFICFLKLHFLKIICFYSIRKMQRQIFKQLPTDNLPSHLFSIKQKTYSSSHFCV